MRDAKMNTAKKSNRENLQCTNKKKVILFKGDVLTLYYIYLL